MLYSSKKYAHACFHAQQAAEKAVKALWYRAGEDPWGHSITLLISGLKDIQPHLFSAIKSLEPIGQVLDRFYIPTRYPNGLPDLTPDLAFNENDAAQCIGYAQKFVNK